MALILSPRALRGGEWMLLGYLAASSAIGILRLPGQPAIRWVLAANALYALLILLAARPTLGRVGRTLREAYPLALLAALYPALDILNNFGGVAAHDLTVQRWEQALFGADPSRTWWQHDPSIFWSTVLHAAYLSYYAIVAAPLIVFLARGRSVDARRAVNWILATFLACYVVFLLFPVAGPYYEYPRPATWFVSNPAARLVYGTLARGSAYGAAFPSSHVAAALVATAAAFRGSPALGRLLALPTLLLTVGVVYCQMHYAVDAVAGVLVAATVVAIGVQLERPDNTTGAGAIAPTPGS